MRARERSVAKKVAVVMDHLIPETDRHAGARHTLDYVRLMLNQGWKVVFLASALTDHRQIKVAVDLSQDGVETYYPEFFNHFTNWSNWLAANSGYFDTVIVNRPHIYQEHREALLALNCPTIYFCHDIQALREFRMAQYLDHNVDQQQFERHLGKELDIMSEVNYTFTPSCFEVDYIRSRNPRLRIGYLPLFVESQKPSAFDLLNRNTAEFIFVGGMAHHPNSDALRWFVSQVFPIVLQKVPHAVFHIVGPDCPKDIENMTSARINVHGPISADALKALYKRVGFAILPLQYGAGVKGKLVEALEEGIPVVSTSIGLEGIPGITDLLKPCDSPSDFAHEICRLINQPSELASMSRALLDFFEHRFSKKVAWEHFQHGLVASERNLSNN